MKTRPLPSDRPGLRFALYPDPEALHIVDELAHLEMVGARVPFGTDSPSPADSRSWLEACVAEEGFRLVTMSMDGLLVGFATGVVAGGRVEIRQVVVASSVRARHPELVGELADTFVDSAELPWADVLVPSSSPALGHLLQEGWRLAVRAGAAVAAAGDPGEPLLLSAAAGR